MKDTGSEDKPATVAEPKQAGEIQDQWDWVERMMWTERMLTTLEKGVRGGKWFSLIDKVWRVETLRRAFGKVKANKGAPGVDHQSIEMFEHDLEENMRVLSQQLQNGGYRPGPVRRQWINKPGSREKRPLGIPTVRDRIVQTAIRDTVEPIFEQTFAVHSYGFRPKRGCKDALRQVDNLLKRGYTWVVDADIKSYFDSIPHSRLMERVEEKISDGRMLALVAGFLKQGVMEGLKYYEPEEGTPQGAVISPLLANIYLNPLDKEMAEQGVEMVRYADDFVVLCQTEEEAKQVLERIQQWMADNGLRLHPTKTRIINAVADGFEFLGYRFDRGRRWPRNKSLMKFKDSIRDKTKRTNGTSLRDIIAELNQGSRGWLEYFKHSNRTTFRTLDQMIRRRLRTILRKRRGRKGVSRGWQDHQRWSNAYFAAEGLFSLEAAHQTACQSSMR